MIKLLWRFFLVVVAALGFAWLADRPEKIVIQSPLREIQVSLLVGVVFLCIALTALYFIWRVLHKLWRSPKTVQEHLRFRKHRKAYESLSRGIIAAGAGDAHNAAKHVAIASDTLKNEPLITLLTAQAAQLKGDRAGVKRAFEDMTNSPETELLGLRGLFAEAKQAGDWAAARKLAERALAKNSRLPWASQAILQVHITARDWAAAAATIAQQSRSGLLPKGEAATKQAALLGAQALADEEQNRERALLNATAAHDLDAKLVPAALVAARCHIAAGNPRKAMKIIRSTYALFPHPDLALVMANTKAQNAPEEQFEQVRDLVGKPETNIESAFALARAAIIAKRWDVAKQALETYIEDHPQARICGLMAQIEDAQGDKTRSREWLARAMHAPRDPMWVSDGVAAAHWTAVSPVTNEMVACEWKPPFELHSSAQWQLQTQTETPLLEPMKPQAKALEPARAPDDPGID